MFNNTEATTCMNCNTVLGFHGLRLLKHQASKYKITLSDISPICAACQSVRNQHQSNNFDYEEV